MENKKLELYHFHKVTDTRLAESTHDNVWKVNNIIQVTKKFESTTFKRVQHFSTSIQTVDENNKPIDICFFQYIHYLLNNYSLSTADLQDLLLRATDISFKADEFKREQVLEQYRINNHPLLPSRLHCIYLTDEKGIEQWSSRFGSAKLDLYRVEAEGNIFKTSEYVIPDESLTYEKAYKAAYNYWNPNFNKIDDDCNEYLTQGKIKILEKIK